MIVYVEIDRSNLLSVIRGNYDCIYDIMDDDIGSDGLIVRCDGMDICKLVTWEDGYWLSHVACTDICHGVHSRYREVHDRLVDLGVYKNKKPAECELCGGSGFIDADSEIGRKTIAMAQLMMSFRGIRLADDGYKPDQLDMGATEILRGFTGR